MDFSDSMQRTAEACFPQATVVIDCFHVIQRLIEGLEEIRLKDKRVAVADSKRKELAFRKDEERRGNTIGNDIRRTLRRREAESASGQKPTDKRLPTGGAQQRGHACGAADKGQVHPAPDGRQVGRAAGGTCQADVCPLSEDKGGILPDMLSKEYLPQRGADKENGQRKTPRVIRQGLCMHASRNQVCQRLHQVQGR